MPRKPKTWEDIYYASKRRGDDPAYALFLADEWQKRQEKRKMSVRAKFRVTEVQDVDWGEKYGELKQITLTPVGGAAGGESEENKQFYAATPGGMIVLGVLNAAAAKQFEMGAEYYVDFTPAEKAN